MYELFEKFRLIGKYQVGTVTGAPQGYISEDINVVVARAFRTAITLLGVFSVGLIIYAGYLFINSQGKSENVDKAQKTITYAIIGLGIAIVSGLIANFVFSKLSNQGLQPL